MAFGDEHHAGRHELQAVPEFGRRQPPVLAGDDGADMRRRQQHLHILAAVFRQHREPVAAVDAELQQRIAQAIDAILQRSTTTGLPPFLHCGKACCASIFQRRSVGILLRDIEPTGGMFSV